MTKQKSLECTLGNKTNVNNKMKLNNAPTPIEMNISGKDKITNPYRGCEAMEQRKESRGDKEVERDRWGWVGGRCRLLLERDNRCATQYQPNKIPTTNEIG